MLGKFSSDHPNTLGPETFRVGNRQTYWHTCGTKFPFNGLSTNHDRWGHCQANHWLDYDAVALAVLVFGISAVTFFVLNL
jgi:hypothetical protein